MREIRAAGNVIGFDRIAITAALNLAHEMLTLRMGTFDIGEFRRRIQRMAVSIDEAVSAQDKLF